MIKGILIRFAAVALGASCISAGAAGINGFGKTTATCLDKDGDGYGPGSGCAGVDADDNDAAVHSTADVLGKYGSLTAFLAHLGYAPTRIWYISPSGSSIFTLV